MGARLAHGPRGDVRNLTIPSNIDPAKPAQVVPASKADLRANLQAAKTELEYLKPEKAKARTLALFSAADQSIVDAVAAHLDLFDHAPGQQRHCQPER